MVGPSECEDCLHESREPPSPVCRPSMQKVKWQEHSICTPPNLPYLRCLKLCPTARLRFEDLITKSVQNDCSTCPRLYTLFTSRWVLKVRRNNVPSSNDVWTEMLEAKTGNKLKIYTRVFHRQREWNFNDGCSGWCFYCWTERISSSLKLRI